MSLERFCRKIRHTADYLQQRFRTTKDPSKQEQIMDQLRTCQKLDIPEVKTSEKVYHQTTSTGLVSQGSRRMAGGIR